MTDDTPDDSGLFGKLPSSRPGIRSPRRASTAKPAEPAREAPKRAAPRPRPSAVRTQPTPQRERPAPKREGRAPEPEHGQAETEPAGLEELAWAGIAVTAEAATLGVRLVTRALDAARRATER